MKETLPCGEIPMTCVNSGTKKMSACVSERAQLPGKLDEPLLYVLAER